MVRCKKFDRELLVYGVIVHTENIFCFVRDVVRKLDRYNLYRTYRTIQRQIAWNGVWRRSDQMKIQNALLLFIHSFLLIFFH